MGLITRPRLVAVAALSVAALLALPAQAGPPASPDGTRTAPYDGFAGTRVVLNTCLADSSCVGDGTIDGAQGTSALSASYSRDEAASGAERFQNQTYQGFTFRVPNGLTRVETTFTWEVTSATTEAASTVGETRAFNGVYAYTSSCYSQCYATSPGQSLQSTFSDEGVPGVSHSLAAPKVVSVTVTVTAKPGQALPKWLTFYGRTYAEAGGQPGQVACVTASLCQPGSTTHAGTAKATIAATLQSLTVASS